MKFFEFLDIEFTNRNLLNQAQFSIARDGEMKAIAFMTGRMRWFFKWLAVPSLIVEWLLIRMNLLSAPKSLFTPKTSPTEKKDAEVLQHESVQAPQ